MLQKDNRMDFIYQLDNIESWELSLECIQFNLSFIINENELQVSKKVLRSIESTSISDLFLYDNFFTDEFKLKRMIWAKNTYSNFIEFKNEQLICDDKDQINEFPLTSKILDELIVYWTQMYTVNTIRSLIHNLHAYQIDFINKKFSDKQWTTIKNSLKVRQKQRDIICKKAKRRLEGLGKVPAYYPVLLYILDLVPQTYVRRNFYVSCFLFMLNTGQRYITMCEIKMSDISSVIVNGDNIIVKIIARITKADKDWNQQFNLEGKLNEGSIMNFVFWFNKFLMEEHALNLLYFNQWNKIEIFENYIWGHKGDFKQKISYSQIYKIWRLFYENAGIPSKLMGVHSFRSGFYCQSQLNTVLKSVDLTTMKELAQLLAGWRTIKDRSRYDKNEQRSLITTDGFVDHPTPEQMLGCDFEFESKWP